MAKEILTIQELVDYTGFSKSHIYKLTHKNQIPFYKPSGKTIFFKFEEIKDWLLKNRFSTAQEIENQASAYLMKKGK